LSYDFSAWASALPPVAFYAILGAWLFVESTGFPISDEPLLLFAGYLSANNRLQLAPTILAALTGKVAASYLAFRLGRRLDLVRLARPDRRRAAGFGRWLSFLRPNRDALRGIEVFFRRWGAWSVFLGRLVPVVRSFISYPAGASRMPSGVFLVATTAGSALWIVAWTMLGALLGST